ncbi:rhomboid family intramembrane serine protease [Burkholderia glumae]|uniref:rhomboid family intramembrane serine protease n=1 Tax=Burkholderia glumae TaxID=337 RepID=UPI000C277000|nr:rhomboid family intramembrane serine protease [Burkholderia glumae]MCR1767513.1 rhomboid family intramembrane serine protease [Burkholderia glumae]PJO23127.1 rhomboid family intramembrane serine protease [Burkholderia glumae AU6208]QHE10691.1 rhomboid family intramembrane serine protease [Burkholderia glumae AU6208]QKM48641.1 Rhomboid protease GluP [Burkholderia glumae]
MNDIASAPGTPPLAPAALAPGASDTYRVRFSVQPRPAGTPRRARRGGLPGSGTLSFGAATGALSLDGMTGGLLRATPFHLALPRAQIFDVSAVGERVCFDLHTPDGVCSVALLAADTAAAARIAGRLPMQVTSAFCSHELDAPARFTGLAQAGPLAWATWGLIAVNLLLFLAMAMSGVSALRPDVPAMIRWGANFGPDTLEGDWWRLLTAPFLHLGVFDLGVNLLVLARVGPLAERGYGGPRLLALFLFAGVMAGMASLLQDPMQCSAGASGAIFGLFGALAAPRLRHRRAPGTDAGRPGLIAPGFAAYCLYYGLMHPAIDNVAHLGGLIAGLLLGLALAPPADPAARDATAGAQLAGAAGMAALLAIALAYPLTHPGAARAQELRFAREYMAMTGVSAEIGGALVALQHAPLDTDAQRQAVSNRVMTDIVPRWNNLHAVLSSLPLPDGSPYRALRETGLGMLDNARRMATTYALMLVRSPTGGNAGSRPPGPAERRADAKAAAGIELAMRRGARLVRQGAPAAVGLDAVTSPAASGPAAKS